VPPERGRANGLKTLTVGSAAGEMEGGRHLDAIHPRNMPPRNRLPRAAPQAPFPFPRPPRAWAARAARAVRRGGELRRAAAAGGGGGACGAAAGRGNLERGGEDGASQRGLALMLAPRGCPHGLPHHDRSCARPRHHKLRAAPRRAAPPRQHAARS
jgi:hypothetical protein